MTAAALPLSIRNISDANDLSISGMVGRTGVGKLMQTGGNLPLPTPDSTVQWYGPTSDQTVSPNGGTPTYWIVNDPAGFGTAIPCTSDPRYAYQVFYRRRGNQAPYDWDFFVAVQTKRDGKFRAPVGVGNQSTMQIGDAYCDPNGVWRKWATRTAPATAAEMAFGLPGGIMIYQTGMRF